MLSDDPGTRHLHEGVTVPTPVSQYETSQGKTHVAILERNAPLIDQEECLERGCWPLDQGVMAYLPGIDPCQ